MQDLLTSFINKKENEKEGITIIVSEHVEKFLPYKMIYHEAKRYSNYLNSKGIGIGNELLYQVEDIEQFIYIFWACQLSKVTAVPIDIGENQENNIKVFRIWNKLNNPYYLASECTLEDMDKNKEGHEDAYLQMEEHFIDLEEIKQAKFSEEEKLEKASGENYIALIQFSSGSTGVPKGIPIKYESLSTHVNDLANREEVTKKDVMLNWAPLSHNLGLVSVHLIGTLVGINQYMMSKKLFVKNPLIWMEKASEHKVTMIYAPNFGYKYILTHCKSENGMNWDLSNIRIAFNGAEPINYELCVAFEKEMRKYGLHKNVMYPAYGCSEATSVISIPKAGDKLLGYCVNRNKLNFGESVEICDINETENTENTVFVAVGKAVANCEVRVCNEKNEVLDDFIIGNLQVRGINVIDEYYNNENATKEAFVGNGWFNTGDLCFKDKDTIVITGRAKEIIFVHGQNYYPNDIERIAEKADSALSGKIACCGIFSNEIQTDKIYFFLEVVGLDSNRFQDLSSKIKNHVSSLLGLYVESVIPVQTLEKTDSGKIQRLKMQKKFVNGDYINLISKYCSADDDFKNETEKVDEVILDIWKKTLHNEEINEDDNFFDLGGSSNLLILLTTKIEEKYPDCISAIDIFEAPTVKELSKLIETRLKDNE